MNIPENTITKRISIDLPEHLISRFDQLRKEWGLRSRGPVIEKLLTELLQEDDLTPKNQQQEIDFSQDKNNDKNYNIDENTSMVLIKKEVKEAAPSAHIPEDTISFTFVMTSPDSGLFGGWMLNSL